MSAKKKTNPHLFWQLSLAAVFLCFGLLVMAQYYTHLGTVGSLENESAANLGLIYKSMADNKSLLEDELARLQAELAQAEAAVANGESQASSMQSRIDALKTAIGWYEVSGPGISVSITGTANLMYYDLIHIVNELMNSGAEAVAINDVRINQRTLISEAAQMREFFNPETDMVEEEVYYVITVNGKALLAPIVVKAIGDPATLETALTYSGGIMDSLSTLHSIYPTIRQAEKLVVPAAIIPEFQYAEEKAAEK